MALSQFAALRLQRQYLAIEKCRCRPDGLDDIAVRVQVAAQLRPALRQRGFLVFAKILVGPQPLDDEALQLNRLLDSFQIILRGVKLGSLAERMPGRKAKQIADYLFSLVLDKVTVLGRPVVRCPPV